MAQPTSTYISNPAALLMPSWRAIWINAKTWLTIFGLILGTAAAVGLVFAVSRSVGNILALVFGLVALFVMMFRLVPIGVALQLAGSKGQKMSLKEANELAKGKGLKMFLLIFYIGIATLVGTILLIIPGVMIATWYSMAPFAMMEENLGFKDSLNRSKDLVKGRFYEVAGVVFFTSAVAVLTLIPILGVLVVIVISVMYQAAITIRYLSLKEYKSANQELPAISPVNYIILVLGVIGTIIGVVMDTNKSNDPQTPLFDNIQTQ